MGQAAFRAKLLGYGLVIAIAALVWGAVLSPLSTWRSNSLAAHDIAARDYGRLLESTRRLQNEMAFFSKSGSQDYIWQAEQSGEATAKIQSGINNLAARSGITLRSISPAPEKQLPFATGVAFRLESEATLDQVLGFILGIESSEPALLIERATLRRSSRPGRTSEQSLMFFQIDVTAPVLIGEAP